MKDEAPSIQVIDRAARLLDAIASYDQPASLKHLAADTGLHPSTAFRILGALGQSGLVERDPAGHYVLGKKLAIWGQRARQGQDLRVEALPIMQSLRDATGETINLTVREGDEVIYIERAIPNRMMRVEQVIGSHAPLHVTAVGKLMLGELGGDFVRQYAARTGLRGYTAHTIVSVDALLAAAHEADSRGYAYDNEEAEEGVGCIGVLIHGRRGEAVAGLSISAPIERRRDAWISLLKEAALAISTRI